MKSWKTSVGGILLSIGALLAGFGSEDLKAVGAALVALGGLLTGVSARDNGVSSEDAGAK
jgi:hypothetical protein